MLNICKFLLLLQSSSIEYIIERNCETTQVGGELDAKGYGIAMKKSLWILEEEFAQLKVLNYF